MRLVIIRLESRRNLYHIVKAAYSLGFEIALVDPKIDRRAALRVYNRLIREKSFLYNVEIYESLSQIAGRKLCFKRTGGLSPELVEIEKYDNLVFYGENGDFSGEELGICDEIVTFRGDYTLPTIVAIALREAKRRLSRGRDRLPRGRRV